MAPVPEFSRPVPLTRLGADPFRQEIVAATQERAALARRFDLLSLDRLTATAVLTREGGGTILLEAEFIAEFVQTCTVTLDPVPGLVAERFALRYGPPDAEPDIDAGNDDPAFEPLTGAAIDIGEAVAQEFSLALPPFPRAEGAAVAETPEIGTADGPFSALSRLADRKRP